MKTLHSHLLLFFLPLVFATSALSQTTWVKNAAGDSAYTDPSPYTNNSDATTTLTITGATNISVTITGRIEYQQSCSWDYVTITDSNNQTQKFCGNINTTYTAAGPSITLKFHSDYSETDRGVTVSIKKTTASLTQNNPRPFKKVWIGGEEFTNIYGDLTVIGNQSLCWKDGGRTCKTPPFSASNNNYFQQNANLDSQAIRLGYVNSTSADLALGPDDEVVDAWLFWIGRIRYTDNNTEANKRNNADRIYLKTPGTNQYVELHAPTEKFSWMVGSDGMFDYGCAVNVKDYVSKSGTYWVADLQATNMFNQGSGWALAVIIKDKTDGDNRSLKNITLYEGFVGVYNATGYQQTISQEFKGFKTPREEDVKANLIFFSGESDRALNDSMSLTNKEGQAKFIKDSLNDTNNVQNATISKDGKNVTTRNPNYENTLGIDIDEIDVGKSGLNIIENNQTETNMTLNSGGDRIFLGMFGFATDLYQPEVCYDYVFKKNEFLIPSDNKTYRTYTRKGDEVSFTIAIWDMKGDIDPRFVSIGLPVTQHEGSISPIMNPDKAFYSITNSNTLIPTDYADMSTPQRPVITIGKGRTDNVGGTLSPDEVYFTKFYFKVNDDTNNSYIEGTFNIEVNATLNYGSGDFTEFLKIKRCPQNPVYSPTWYQFNVEKPFTSTVPSDPTEHYSLPTRIAGKDFDYSVASYTKDAQGKYTVPEAADGITVDVEMINIDAFDDNASFFKCGNTEPSIIVMPSRFVYFDDGQNRVNIDDPIDLTKTYAIRSATFRMWMLIDANNTIVSDGTFHDKNDNDYFAQVYLDKFKADKDPDGKRCGDACTAPYNYVSPREEKGFDPNAHGCYACLRDYFAEPYCARDNFAIRPKAIRAELGDMGIKKDQNSLLIAQNDSTLTPTNTLGITAGYPYELNLTVVDYNDQPTKGYTTYEDFVARDALTSVPSRSRTNSALLKFEGSTSACVDTTHSTLRARFDGGRTYDDLLIHSNVGSYSFEIWDSNWTKVDNASVNPYKTIFDQTCKNSSDEKCNDCILGMTTDEFNPDGKTGCIFSSRLEAIDGTINPHYQKINLTIYPYYFDINSSESNMTLVTTPFDHPGGWVYMNNFTKDQTRTMAASFQGKIIARSADGNLTSNYVTGCAAEDVTLWLEDYNVSSPGKGLIYTEDGITKVPFQQWLNTTVGTQPVKDDTGDMNATLTEANFFKNSDTNGSAPVDLRYNFAKPYDKIVNPVIVGFNTFNAASPKAQSYADHSYPGFHIPVGSNYVDKNITYYFAKVFETDGIDGMNIITPDTSVSFTIQVDTYCKDTSDFICAQLPGFTSTPPANAETIDPTYGGGWYRMEGHNSTNGDGKISMISSNVNGVNITPSNNIYLDTNGSSSTITIDYPIGNARPVDPVITITPDEWLKYKEGNATGLPSFNLHFISQGLRWKGTGKTGHVLETEPTMRQNSRINW